MIPRSLSRHCLAAAALCLSAAGAAHAESPAAPPAGATRLLRFPTTDGSHIAFTYAGQVYTVGIDGGVARRVTDAPGYCSFPRFSPDGAQLAFTAQYDGNTEVYVMPGAGGVPKRLTTTATLGRDDISDRMGPNNLVMGWKNTEPRVVFRSRMRSFNDFIGALYTVGMDAELPSSCRCRAAGLSRSRPTTPRWRTTASSGSSARGNTTAAAWRTTSGFMI